MLIAIINQSSLVSDDQIVLMTRAVQSQVSLHLLPAFNLKTTTLKFFSDITKIPGHAWVICFANDNANDSQLQKDFQNNNDLVNSFIYCQTLIDNNESISATLSREVCEMITNRFSNIWMTGPMTLSGSEYAYNICEPVAKDEYTITVDGIGIKVANFVFPSFFNMNAAKPENMPFDYLKLLSAPFTTTDGGVLTIRKAISNYSCFNIGKSRSKNHKNRHYRSH